MDGQRFDRMVRMLAGGVSRRAVLRGAAAGLAAAVGLRAGRAGAEQVKKPLCHATGDPANPWVVISVAEPAWQTHYDHGDKDFNGVTCDCVGSGTVQDGEFCLANFDCCSGQCNLYTHQCFSGCLPDGAESNNPTSCCSGYIVGRPFGQPSICAVAPQ